VAASPPKERRFAIADEKHFGGSPRQKIAAVPQIPVGDWKIAAP
jgi:hypothetical protein